MYTEVSFLFMTAIVVSQWDKVMAGCFDVPIADICSVGTQYVPYMSSRDPSTTLTNETLQQKYCDLFAMETYQWFRSEFTMTAICPEMYKCGTKFPIWMDGSHPEPDEGIVNRTACLRDFENCCLIRYSLTAVNCGQYYAYCLLDLPSGCHQRYCFDRQTGLSSTPAWTSANLNWSVPIYSTTPLLPEPETTVPVENDRQTGLSSTYAWTSAIWNRSVPSYSTTTSSGTTVPVVNVQVTVVDTKLIIILTGVFVLTVVAVVAIFVLFKCRRHLKIEDQVARSTWKTPNKFESQTLSGLGGDDVYKLHYQNFDKDTDVFNELSSAEYASLHLYETIPEIDKSSPIVKSEYH